MLYHYRCKTCRCNVASETPADHTTCPICKDRAKRDFGFSVTRSMPEHYNSSVGQYISNNRQFTDALKRQSDEASIRTGVDHDYQPLSPAEMADPTTHGADPSLLEETYRRAHNEASR